eukprot:s1033_g19.t1
MIRTSTETGVSERLTDSRMASNCRPLTLVREDTQEPAPTLEEIPFEVIAPWQPHILPPFITVPSQWDQTMIAMALEEWHFMSDFFVVPTHGTIVCFDPADPSFQWFYIPQDGEGPANIFLRSSDGMQDDHDHMKYLYQHGQKRAVIFEVKSLTSRLWIVYYQNVQPEAAPKSLPDRPRTPWPTEQPRQSDFRPIADILAAPLQPQCRMLLDIDHNDFVQFFHSAKEILHQDLTGLELPETSRQALLQCAPTCPAETYDRLLIYVDGSSQAKHRRRPPQWIDEFDLNDSWCFLVLGEQYHPNEISFLGFSCQQAARRMGFWALQSRMNLFDFSEVSFKLFLKFYLEIYLGLHTYTSDPCNDFVDHFAKLEARHSMFLPRQSIDLRQWKTTIPHLWMLVSEATDLPRFTGNFLELPAPQLPEVTMSQQPPPLDLDWNIASMTVSLATANVLSLYTGPDGYAGKLSYLRTQMTQHHLNMLGLQEARSEAGRSCVDRVLRLSSGAFQGAHGVELWINLQQPIGYIAAQPLYFEADSFIVTFASPRAMLVLHDRPDLRFWILVAHAPQSGRTDTERADWWKEIEALLRQHLDPDEVDLYVLIDANAASGAQDSVHVFEKDDRTSASQITPGTHESQKAAPLPMLHEHGHPCQSVTELRECWIQFFQQMECGARMSTQELRQKWCHNLAAFSQEQFQLPAHQFPSLFDLECAYRRVKPGKATGDDGIPSDLCHACPTTLARWSYTQALKLCAHGQETLLHKGGKLVSAYKHKGPQSDPSSYRSLMISSHIAKTLHRSVKAVQTRYYESYLQGQQVGGRARVPVQMGMHSVRAFLRQNVQQKASVAILFLDLQEAFYRVLRPLAVGGDMEDTTIHAMMHRLNLPAYAREELHRLLQTPSATAEALLPEHLQRALLATHTDTHFRVHGQTDHVRTEAGSRPGDPFADMVFGFLFARILKVLEERLVANEVLTHLPARDGASLFQTDEEGILMPFLGPTWMDDLAICVAATTAPAVERKAATTAGILLEVCQEFGVSPNLKRGKTELLLSLTPSFFMHSVIH